jgi:hypothetical protein
MISVPSRGATHKNSPFVIPTHAASPSRLRAAEIVWSLRRDEHVFDLAMNGRADMLVTFNLDDFVEASKTFQIGVVTPAAALRRLR